MVRRRRTRNSSFPGGKAGVLIAGVLDGKVIETEPGIGGTNGSSCGSLLVRVDLDVLTSGLIRLFSSSAVEGLSGLAEELEVDLPRLLAAEKRLLPALQRVGGATLSMSGWGAMDVEVVGHEADGEIVEALKKGFARVESLH